MIKKFDFYLQIIGFMLMHIGAIIALYYYNLTFKDIIIIFALYAIRMFSIMGGYHRYFSHRSFKTTRIFQFILAFIGASSSQRGPIWWAATHRIHHKESDTQNDVHSPVWNNFWYSHIGWIFDKKNLDYDKNLVKDLTAFPEIVLLEKYSHFPLIFIHILFFLMGGMKAVSLWNCVSIILVAHVTFMVNSVVHVFGKRRFSSTDDSRNNWFVAFLTGGDGWHNNHHYYQSSANAGFYWWEYDFVFYTLKFLSLFNIVWDLKTPPKNILYEGLNVTPSPFLKD